MNENSFHFLPVVEATSPFSGTYFRLIRDSWWIVHPERGLVFFKRPHYPNGMGAPQCNPNEMIARKMVETIPYEFPVDVRHIERVWVPIDPRQVTA
jgi:hypothetical protein